jgi:hypothetical protein
MTSTFRSISLAGETASLACFATSYRVQFDGKGNDTDVIPIPSDSTAILRTLHERAAERDWRAEVERTLPGDAETQRDIRNWLIERGPGAVLGPALDGAGDELDVLRDPRLQVRAEAILQRKTMFLLPEDPEKALLKKAPLLVDSISEQLHTLLNHEPWPDFSFVRIGALGEGKGMLDLILENLHGKMSAEIFKDSPAEREGPVLLCGLTGTGKTYGTRLFAKSQGFENFVPVNLSAVTDTTLESRIRGYVEGVYTGAKKGGAAGWFEEANGGILFLDEFQSVSLPFQTQLLDLLNAVSDRVELTRMGNEGKKRDVYNVKVVLAVNEDIGELLHSGRLREDLFYRMRHLLMFPTLRERLDKDPAQLMVLLNTYRWRSAPKITKVNNRDMETGPGDSEELQIRRLRSMFSTFEREAIDHLLQHNWPGNLRELERVASDLFWDSDDRDEPLIKHVDTAKAVSRFQIPKRRVDPGSAPPPVVIPTELAAILNSVESALRKHRFIIVRVLAELKLCKVYKITSPKTLKRFLDENCRYLSPTVANDSRVQKFMKWTVAPIE